MHGAAAQSGGDEGFRGRVRNPYSDLYAKRAGHSQRRVYAIFMEPVKPISAGEMQTIDAADFGPAALGAERLERVHRMVIYEATKNFVGADLAVGVQGDAIIFFHRQGLQAIHVIGHGDRAVPVARIEMEQVVPGGAGFGSGGEQGAVRMQYNVIGGGAEVLQDVALGLAGILEQGKHAIAVGGENYVIEALRWAIVLE